MLLQQFPGRTLEELDGINWPRLMRALAADDVGRIEQLRDLQRKKQAKPSQAEWMRIRQHDEWWREWQAAHPADDDDDDDDNDDEDGDGIE